MLSKALRAGLQSGTIMSCADIAIQLAIEKEYDPERTLRWTVCGLALHGPYFFAGFSVVDKYFGAAAPSLGVVAKKTAIAQFILFPPYLVALFGLMGLLERHPDIGQKIQNRVPEAFLGGCVYWPVANGLNFAFVSPSFRVPYLAASAGIWNAYLSWMNSKDRNRPNRRSHESRA